MSEKEHQHLTSRVVTRFSCLGDKCEDTCCSGWSMQVDENTLSRWRQEAPDLLTAVAQEEDGLAVMRRDPDSAQCVKLEQGLCGIHKHQGAPFLSDACYFYPRVTRRLGGKTLMTASLSCPEIARLALADDQAALWEEGAAERLPHALKDYLPPGLSQDDALAVHHAFLNAVGGTSCEAAFLRIASAARALERGDIASWTEAAPFFLEQSAGWMPPAEADALDPFHLVQAACGLAVATRKKISERLQRSFAEMESALAVTLDRQTAQIEVTAASLAAYQRLRESWPSEAYAPILLRWLRMQLALGLFPFAGLGQTLSERVTILGVRLATARLALMCGHALHGPLPMDHIARILQSLARLMDHLGDAALSLAIYAETGWTRESRLRGVIEL